jgi:hypothetical protein
MLRSGISSLAFLLPCAAFAQAPIAAHVKYDTYAAGLQAAEVEAGFSFSPSSYQMSLSFHTVGMVGFLFGGHQLDVVNGSWHGRKAVPTRFAGQGRWRDQDRLVEIDYQRGRPIVRKLVPPDTAERETVPDDLQADTIDTLSALVQLIRVVADTGRCEMAVRSFDGRRTVEIEAHTVGEQTLASSNRSSFAGKALRCDFAGRLLAGFKFGDNRERVARPMHGSAWLAPVIDGGPPLPVRLAFETRWFGDATMYLTAVGPGSDVKVVPAD